MVAWEQDVAGGNWDQVGQTPEGAGGLLFLGPANMLLTPRSRKVQSRVVPVILLESKACGEGAGQSSPSTSITLLGTINPQCQHVIFTSNQSACGNHEFN